MPELSVIIPSRNSPFLTKTIQDILEKSSGDIKIVVNVDENWPDPLLEDKRVAYIHPGTPRGMKWGINACAALASGNYLMKTDDHCMFAPGFDKVLVESHLEDNWVQIPRRYSLDAENWKVDEKRPFRDYHYLCFPTQGKAHDEGMHDVEWWSRQKERSNPEFDIDDTMTMQGSCWFMTKNHFDNFLHGLNENEYGNIAQEAQEISNKTWLGGGRLVVNKKTWYAHLHKGRHYGRMYHLNDKIEIEAHNKAAKYWMDNHWEERIHDIAWLVEKFWPVPTWEPNWKEIWASYKNEST
ncbi:hypothetical protein A2803_05310 [Candidatus Woesebacteria bacterium RIFCSPHIGHO2_01_FULL_44_21]|uniref:Glycosyltransferase 2-like domain-containing protein n=1 Tax=Candidatus Woesebacteria bacterium RIFCSPHIGHO2_01_FULL_44_21 TaxID=1802503 RepID=A0A1F7YXK6_9BACT|nr:MAG: hypothetical protein A2803_05310 [Candidatus Woesebacteria bacterium RIFCSPHIGHO2_01_FULL_44_21]OGM69064.1 MAG: hypothetical protein A2897_04505 [Candidatus Woesebacteria bacterium RIFCSPLOWO2_01_FULL_44_24b]